MLLQENKAAKLGWLIRPLERVGVYVPGFSAPLPSSRSDDGHTGEGGRG